MHGKGTYVYQDGNKHVGSWIDDKMHGQATYTQPDGIVFKEVFDMGKPVSKEQVQEKSPESSKASSELTVKKRWKKPVE